VVHSFFRILSQPGLLSGLRWILPHLRCVDFARDFAHDHPTTPYSTLLHPTLCILYLFYKSSDYSNCRQCSIGLKIPRYLVPWGFAPPSALLTNTISLWVRVPIWLVVVVIIVKAFRSAESVHPSLLHGFSSNGNLRQLFSSFSSLYLQKRRESLPPAINNATSTP
jgi:hypothetical protein